VKSRAVLGLIAVVSVLAGVMLAGCRSNAGVAATVGDLRITEAQLTPYVRAGGELTPSESASPSASPSASTNPKATVLATLIRQELFSRLLQTNGGVPSGGALDALHDKALQVQYSADPATADQQIAANLASSGLSAKFRGLFLRMIELLQVVIDRQHATQPSEVIAAVAKQGVPVRVNPRYGTWASSQLSLDTSGGQPSYLHLFTSSAAAAPSA
jgi:hypothetical protein